MHAMTQPQEPIAYGCYRHPNVATFIRCQRCGRPICGQCMISAAVGFQCPECVSTGARQTRQNQGPYGGTRPRDPRLTAIVLIALNAAVWLSILLTGGSRSRLADLLALLPAGRCDSVSQPDQYYPDAGAAACAALGDGNWHAGVASGAWWQVLTSAFTHVEVWHIGLNMLALWFLGPGLEQVLGRARFLAVYLISAVGGSAAVMWLSESSSSVLGASGAIFGLLGALLVIAYKVQGDVRNILIWLGLNVAITFLGNGISWQGHLGGLVGGALATAILVYAPRAHRTRMQWLGIAALAVVAVTLVVVRALALA